MAAWAKSVYNDAASGVGAQCSFAKQNRGDLPCPFGGTRCPHRVSVDLQIKSCWPLLEVNDVTNATKLLPSYVHLEEELGRATSEDPEAPITGVTVEEVTRMAAEAAAVVKTPCCNRAFLHNVEGRAECMEVSCCEGTFCGYCFQEFDNKRRCMDHIHDQCLHSGRTPQRSGSLYCDEETKKKAMQRRQRQQVEALFRRVADQKIRRQARRDFIMPDIQCSVNPGDRDVSAH